MSPTSDQLKAAEEQLGFTHYGDPKEPHGQENPNGCPLCRLAQLLSEREAKARREGGDDLLMKMEAGVPRPQLPHGPSSRRTCKNSCDECSYWRGAYDMQDKMSAAARQALNELK